MSPFERKFGKYAIRNLSFVLVACYAIGYVLQFADGSNTLIYYLSLNPYAIVHGQVWRLFTWILIPPPTSNIFFALLMIYVYCSIGTTLERTWGTYRYNVYLFQGMLFTIAGSFLLMGYFYLFHGDAGVADQMSYFTIVSLSFGTYYVNMSIFLAYAATFPEAQFFLMFIIPIKAKVLGIIYGILLLFDFFSRGVEGKFVIGASLLNFIVFFITSRSKISLNPKQIRRRQEFKRDVRRNTGITKHKCAICGRTEENSPGMQFRFCSKCDGNYEYCEEHLYTHTHVKRG
ncbi:MAG: hypothetical protein J1F42_10705 [Lachnospiraceae bacterium]|nr:hypothetical protein [Lachnospiraceae bacterium]